MAYAVHELTVEVDTGSGYQSIGGLETADIKINNEIKDWTEIGSGGWKSRLVTAKDLSISFSGKRIEGDTGNDYIASLADEVGSGCNTSVRITFKNNDIMLIPCVIEVTSFGGGGSTDVGALEFNCLSNGQPTFTGNFSA